MSDAWEKFLAGHWQKETPLRPGFYPRAFVDEPVTIDFLWRVKLGDTGQPYALVPGDGWWWSEPIPDLPKPPPWETP